MVASGKQESDESDERKDGRLEHYARFRRHGSGHSTKNQSCDKRLDQLPPQALHNEAQRFPVPRQHQSCKLGKEKVQEPSNQ